MNWNQLHYVITIAREQNITKAAQKLYISQPSLSMSLKTLEKELGTSLFERKNGELTLTYAGELFYEWAESSLRSKQSLIDKLDDISNHLRHKIRIGLSPHRSVIMLPEILERFYAEAGNCDVQIIEEPTYALKELLEQNELDLMIDVPHPDALNYQSELLAEEHILLAVPNSLLPHVSHAVFASDSDLPAASHKMIQLDKIKLSLPFILLTEKQVIGQMSRRIFETCSLYPETSITCSNVESALTLTSRGLGATFIPEYFAGQKRFAENVTYFSIEHYHDTRKICLIYRKNQYQNKHLALMLDLFREIVPTLYTDCYCSLPCQSLR
nr:LysR family transcriptional regulator [uncultured Mediterraneibacter sp.]